MATNNSINAPIPFSVANGGTGLATLTAHSILLGEGTSAITPLVLGAGQVLIGTTAGDPAAATLSAGTGINITSASGAITIASTNAINWNSAASSTQAMVAEQGYYTNNGASSVAFTLPATQAAGTTLEIAGYSSGGWTLAQNALQSIQFGSVTTTVGIGGSLASTNRGDGIKLLCVVANTTWVSIGGTGNLTYV
jgi:hypothetical protein